MTVAVARDLLYYFSQLLCYGNQSLNRYNFCLAALRFDILSLNYIKKKKDQSSFPDVFVSFLFFLFFFFSFFFLSKIKVYFIIN